MSVFWHLADIDVGSQNVRFWRQRGHLRRRVAVRETETGLRGNLVYTIRKDAGGELHVYRHGAALERAPALVLLEEPNGRDGGNIREENKGRPISTRDGV